MATKREKIVTSIVVIRAALIDDTNQILLIKRSSEARTNIGKWEFPGGKLEKGELLDEVLQREVEQETGISIENKSNGVAHVTSSFITKVPDYTGMTLVTITQQVKISAKPVVKLSHEHDDYVWVTKKKALIMDLKDEARETLTSNSF